MQVCSQSRLFAVPGENVRLPVAHMVCNQSPPVGDKPSLMTFRCAGSIAPEGHLGGGGNQMGARRCAGDLFQMGAHWTSPGTCVSCRCPGSGWLADCLTILLCLLLPACLQRGGDGVP